MPKKNNRMFYMGYGNDKLVKRYDEVVYELATRLAEIRIQKEKKYKKLLRKMIKVGKMKQKHGEKPIFKNGPD